MKDRNENKSAWHKNSEAIKIHPFYVCIAAAFTNGTGGIGEGNKMELAWPPHFYQNGFFSPFPPGIMES